MATPWVISLTDVETGRFQTFASLIKASEFLGHSKQYLKSRLADEKRSKSAFSVDGKEYKVRIESIGRKKPVHKKKPEVQYVFDGYEIRHLNNHSSQLCTECARAVGFCEWSKHLKPVEGWEAVPTMIKHMNKRSSTNTEILVTDSYRVISCPMFIEEGKTVEERREQRKMLKGERLNANNNSSV